MRCTVNFIFIFALTLVVIGVMLRASASESTIAILEIEIQALKSDMKRLKGISKDTITTSDLDRIYRCVDTKILNSKSNDTQYPCVAVRGETIK